MALALLGAPTPEECINFLRLARIVLDNVAGVLRSFFRSKFQSHHQFHWQPKHAHHVSSKVTCQYKEQTTLLKRGKIQEWDPTLLCQILLKLTSHWKFTPDEIQGINDLRQIRNDFFGHPPEAAISSIKLQGVIKVVAGAYILMGQHAAVDGMKKIETDPIAQGDILWKLKDAHERIQQECSLHRISENISEKLVLHLRSLEETLRQDVNHSMKQQELKVDKLSDQVDAHEDQSRQRDEMLSEKLDALHSDVGVMLGALNIGSANTAIPMVTTKHVNDHSASGNGPNTLIDANEVEHAHQNFISAPPATEPLDALTTGPNDTTVSPTSEETSSNHTSELLHGETVPLTGSQAQACHGQEQSGGDTSRSYYHKMNNQLYSEMENTIQELEAKIEIAEREKAVLESKLSEANEELNVVKANFDETTEKLSNDKANLDKKTEELSEAKANLDKKIEEITSLNKELADLKEKLKKRENDVSRLEKQKKELEVEKAKVEGQRDAYKEMVLKQQPKAEYNIEGGGGCELPALMQVSGGIDIPSPKATLRTDRPALGYGSISTVYEGQFGDNSCAVKVMSLIAMQLESSLPLNLGGGTKEQNIMHFFSREADCLKQIDHQNIVKVYDIRFFNGKFPAFILEKLSCTLTSYLHSVSDLSQAVQLSFSCNIASALEYLHQKEIYHRDLCSDNILLDTSTNTPVAKVSDFGSSKIKRMNPTSSRTAIVGRAAYYPPELIQHPEKYDETIDIFMFGVVMIQIAHTIHQFESVEEREQLFDKLSQKHFLRKHIVWCMKQETSQRPSPGDIHDELKKQYDKFFQSEK